MENFMETFDFKEFLVECSDELDIQKEVDDYNKLWRKTSKKLDKDKLNYALLFKYFFYEQENPLKIIAFNMDINKELIEDNNLIIFSKKNKMDIDDVIDFLDYYYNFVECICDENYF